MRLFSNICCLLSGYMTRNFLGTGTTLDKGRVLVLYLPLSGGGLGVQVGSDIPKADGLVSPPSPTTTVHPPTGVSSIYFSSRSLVPMDSKGCWLTGPSCEGPDHLGSRSSLAACPARCLHSNWPLASAQERPLCRTQPRLAHFERDREWHKH